MFHKCIDNWDKSEQDSHQSISFGKDKNYLQVIYVL